MSFQKIWGGCESESEKSSLLKDGSYGGNERPFVKWAILETRPRDYHNTRAGLLQVFSVKMFWNRMIWVDLEKSGFPTDTESPYLTRFDAPVVFVDLHELHGWLVWITCNFVYPAYASSNLKGLPFIIAKICNDFFVDQKWPLLQLFQKFIQIWERSLNFAILPSSHQPRPCHSGSLL